MSASPSTPKAKSTAPVATPTTTRVTSTHAIQSSPHYTTTRRHSLYGTEDRVVIDPGSRIWKVGFSGEGKPRDVFYADAVNSESLWSWSRATDPSARTEEDRMLEVNIERCMRSVFHKSLLTDPKSRKVILVEHPLLPLYIKDIFAKVLFGNLQVPSVSFASSHLLSLLSVGRITGLVIDCGHIESTVLPIFAARPMFPHLRTTPLAGSRFTSHLRALLLLFGSYIPPPANLSSATPHLSSRMTHVPQEILTDALVEDIKTRYCFVSTALETHREAVRPPSPPASESDLPPSSDAATSESEFSRASEGVESTSSLQQASSEFEVAADPSEESSRKDGHLQMLANMYTRHSTASDIQFRVVPPTFQQLGTGRGTLIVPGWIRERAAEVLFEGGDVDESSVAEVILEALLKVPVDLRKTFASSILVTGGTAMLPGFVPRLHAELVRAVGATSRTRQGPTRSGRHLPPMYDRYAPLRPLVQHIAILDNPAPSSEASPRALANAGKAPAFSPALMAWVGGSLAGALKTGGVEVSREKWDEAFATRNEDDGDDDAMDVVPPSPEQKPRGLLPDWTRTPLPVGAQPAVPKAAMVPASPQTAVGA